MNLKDNQNIKENLDGLLNFNFKVLDHLLTEQENKSLKQNTQKVGFDNKILKDNSIPMNNIENIR